MGLKGIINSAVHTAENVLHKAEDNVKKTVKTAENVTSKQVNSFVKNVTSQINGNNSIVKNFIPPIPNPVKPLSFLDKAVNVGKNLFGKVSDFGNNLLDKGKNLLGKVADFGSKALDFGKKVFNEVKDRALDIGRSAVNLVTEGLGGLGRSIFEGAGKVFSGLGKTLNPAPLGKLFSGDFSGAWNDFKNNVVDGAKQVGEGLVQATIKGPVSTFIVGLQNAVSAVQTATGLEPAGRGLNDSEKSELRKVYGDSIDLSQIRIKEGNIGLNNFLAPHTIGNTIYIPQGWLDKNSPNYDKERNELLVHETAHTWQYQNGGTDYIADSVWNQLKGVISGGDRNAAYDFQTPIKEGKSWTQLNPEQQAHLIETAYSRGLFDNPNAKFTLNDGTDVTNYVRDAIQQMLNGKGAA
jgi:hypothetical protein